MMASVTFIFAYLFCLINLVLLKKNTLKESFIKRLTICTITQLCVGAVFAKALNIFKVPVCLWTMSMGYAALGGTLLFFKIRNKGIQLFELSKVELYSILVILSWFTIIFVIVFTPNISLNYVNVDPANHFYYAQEIMRTGKLGNMYFAALYNALFMEILKPFISELSLYKAFILADSLANLLNVFMFYCLAHEFCKNRFTKLILPFVCLAYFLGWPFYNYAIGGFVYFGWGITLLAYVVWMIRQVEIDSQERLVSDLKIAIATYCVLQCYMLFVPILVLIIAISVWPLYRNSIMRNRKVQIMVFCAGTILALICIRVAFVDFFGGNIRAILDSFQLQGGIHRELYNDFLYLLPMILYILICSIKKRKFDVVLRTEIITGCYTAVMLILCLLGYISSYYYYKTYYILWFFSWIICMEALDVLYEKDKIILCSLGGSVLLAVLLGVIGVDNRYLLRDRLVVPTELTGNDNNVPFSIYGETQQYLAKDKNNDDQNAMLEICQYILSLKNIDMDQLVFVSESYYIGTWFNDFVGGTNVRIENSNDLEQIITGLNKEYMVLHQNSEMYRESKNMIEYDYEKIYDNGYYGLYKRYNF